MHPILKCILEMPKKWLPPMIKTSKDLHSLGKLSTNYRKAPPVLHRHWKKLCRKENMLRKKPKESTNNSSVSRKASWTKRECTLADGTRAFTLPPIPLAAMPAGFYPASGMRRSSNQAKDCRSGIKDMLQPYPTCRKRSKN